MKVKKRLEAAFKGKKITILGLGLLGRGVNVAKFLAEQGAILTITDLKTAEQLASSLRALKKYPHIRFHLGGHQMSDFRNVDMVIKAAGVPLDSPYVKEARKYNIPVEMDASLFAKFAPEGVTIVGVTGTRGKSTVTHLIYHILSTSKSPQVLPGRNPGLAWGDVGDLGSRGGKQKQVLLGGNVRGLATLPLLKKVKAGDIVVLELDSWQLQGFGDAKISPHIAVFTTFFPDHLNYYKGNLKKYFADKANIFKYQKQSGTLIVGDGVVKNMPVNVRKRASVVSSRTLPRAWHLRIPGEHNRFNAACAVSACHALGVPKKEIKNGVESFDGVEGRLQFLRVVRGIKIYNDNNSTTPEATIAALRALGSKGKKNIVLIMGGDEKNLDMTELVRLIPGHCSKVVLFKERGTDKIRDKVFACQKNGVRVYEEEGLANCISLAFAVAKKGETILYSPAFSSFGKYFKNEYDRGDQFVKLARKLK